MGKINDLTGRKFGRLTALEYVGRKNGRTLWRCICDCGNETTAGYSNLLNGITRSCGCLGMESRIRIGHNNRTSASLSLCDNLRSHPLYGLWSSMLTRCYNKNSKGYKHYGGRGIKVCDRWKTDNMGFENFLVDMGERPSPLYTLDRVDVDGNYCPENCRWATQTQQSNNRTDSIILFYHGKRVYVKNICDRLHLSYSRVAHQIQKGFDINAIIEFGGADFRRKGFKNNTDKYKNFNRNITIFVPELESNGTEIEG